MNSSYERIYDDLFRKYHWRFDLGDYTTLEKTLVDTVKRSIENESSESKDVVRPDAKYFLLVNFHQMIVTPIVERSDRGGFIYNKLDLNDLQEKIRSDIETIVRASHADNEGKISGHAVMSAIDKHWKKLAITKMSIWG